MPQLLLRNEPQRGVAETLAELATAVVRLRGDFERGRPCAQPTAGWQESHRIADRCGIDYPFHKANRKRTQRRIRQARRDLL